MKKIKGRKLHQRNHLFLGATEEKESYFTSSGQNRNIG
jgi:hypothetical protein